MQEQGYACAAKDGEVVIGKALIKTNKAAAHISIPMCGRKEWIDMHRPGSLHALLESYRECESKPCEGCKHRITDEHIAAILTGAYNMKSMQVAIQNCSLTTCECIDNFVKIAKVVGFQSDE